MKLSYNWLNKYLNSDKSPQELADILTQVGLEVEEIFTYTDVPATLNGLVCGKVVECIKHPDADKLSLTKVDVGQEELLNIVCGAPNIAQGLDVIVAKVGTTLHPMEGEPFKITKSKIRGQVSEGMICAEDEIGTGHSHEGVLILAGNPKPGTAYTELLDGYSDTIIDINITPNRPDAASHIGAARDVAAFLETSLALPEINKPTGNSQSKVEIEISDESCGRYSGLVIKGVSVKPSPKWLQNALKAIGSTPINNIVDCTNYVLHELGHPLHAFDLDKIEGGKINIRKSKEGEELVTLDKQTRKLTGTELVIADATKPLAMAGVIGGLDSAISETTTAIFIESAWFHPTTIRQAARKHQIFTDASFHFERGADPNATIDAMRRVTSLILETAGGEVSSQEMDVYPNPVQPIQISLKKAFLDKITGTNIPLTTASTILNALGFEVLTMDENEMTVATPTFKPDVTRPIDVVEEILRIWGLNKISFSKQVKSILQVDGLYAKEQLEKKLSLQLHAQGFYETYHLSMGAEKENADAENSIQILNPISADLKYMRDNMLRHGLKSILYNLNRQRKNIRLYEWGNSYGLRDETFTQKRTLSIWATGFRHEDNWHDKNEKLDFYFMKSVILNLLSAAGLKDLTEKPTEGIDKDFSLSFFKGEKEIALASRISTPLLKQFDITQEVFYGEIDMAVLLKAYSKKNTKFKAISKFPFVERDLALVVPREMKYEQIKNLITKTDRKLIREISVFDVYEGKQMEEGKKSYGIRLHLENEETTLDEKTIDKLMSRIIYQLKNELDVGIR